MSIVAIDPGTTNTGLVWMDELRVLAAETIRFKGAVRGDQDALLERAESISLALAEWLEGKEREAVVIEGFVGYPGRQGGYAYQTPYLCGYLHRTLAGEPLVIQTSRQVLNPRTPGNCAWVKAAMAAGREAWGDSSLCTNDHERSALAHGVYYYRQEGHRWTREAS